MFAPPLIRLAPVKLKTVLFLAGFCLALFLALFSPVEIKAEAPKAPGSTYILASTGTTGSAHTAPVNDLAVSPDGRYLATAGADTLLKIWQLSGQSATLQSTSLCTFYNFPDPLVAVAWSSDSQWLATGDVNGGLKIWNLKCGSAPLKLAGQQGAVRAVAFSPDGRFLASGGSDNNLRLWDLTTYQLVYTFDNGHFGINDIRWSPSSNRLAFVSTSGQLTMINVAGANSQVAEQRSGPGSALRSLAWSSDGHWLAAGDDSGGITLWDSSNGSLNIHFQATDRTAALLSLAFSADSSALASGGGDNSVKLWSINSAPDGTPRWQNRLNLSGHQAAVRAVAFGPNNLLVSGSDDWSVRLWDSQSGASRGIVAGNLASLTTTSWSPDGNFVVSGTNQGQLTVWQASSGQLNRTIRPEPATDQQDNQAEAVRASAFSPDGHWLAAGGDDGILRVWQWPAPDQSIPFARIVTGEGAILALAFSPDGQFIATAGRSGQVHLWRWDGKSLRLAAATPSSSRVIRTLAFSPTGNFLVSGDDSGKLTLWNSPDLTSIRQIAGHRGYVKSVAFDRSGANFASAGGDGSVRWWNILQGTAKAAVQLPLPVEALALSPDGQTLATSTDDGAVTVWRAADSRTYLTIMGQSLTPLGLSFAPQGTSRLASATQDGTLQVWNLNLATPAATPLAAPGLDPLTTPGAGFVQVSGDRLTLNGQPVKLKGFNFYQHLAPWGAFWQHWNGPQVAADLDKAAGLGANVLRILVPYGSGYEWTQSDGIPRPEMLDEMDQLLALASARGMRVLVTLYDFYGDFPLAGTTEEAANWRYLDSLLARYKDDRRVLGWDLHNEPDNYNLWQAGYQGQVLDWLKRVALHLRQSDSNHFVTVGFGNWTNLSFSGPDGVDALALSDVVSLHAYNPDVLERQLSEVRTSGGNNLPTILEEFGWPSGPGELTADYSETQQAEHYQRSLDFISQQNLSGGLAWTLWDFTPSSVLNLKPDIYQQFFGLVRLDGTLKPAALVFKQAYPASSLTLAATPTSDPDPVLTVRPVDPNLYPQYFPQTGFAVPTPFKEYWNRMGGLDSFGYPISGVRLEGGYLVQYFERVRMEYHPEAASAPDYAGLPRGEQLKRIVMLGLLTDEWLASQGRTFSTAGPAPGNLYFKETGHNLGGRFESYWQSHGGLQRFGLPLSEEVEEVSATDGKTYRVQYFERARFEYHPEAAGTPYEVELGLLGREILSIKGQYS